jgi:UDP-N-acetyl-D-glucosamine dehydrogenase
MKKVTVVGLGYVGLPLALLADKKGYQTIGLDIDERKVDSLKAGKTYIDDVSAKQIKDSGVTFTTDAGLAKTSDVIVICVPTPVNEEKEPDLSPVKGAIKSVAAHVKPGALVVIESTVNPGVCDEVVAPLLESLSGKQVGADIYLAHCPERINPGDPKWHVGNINRVVGANSDKALVLAQKFYESIIDAQIKPMGSLKEAEAVKIVENSFRDINIAFVNELAMSFSVLGINAKNVIDGAATKPFAFMAHYPGIGVGGHCIPVDPYYLIEYARGHGFEHKFLSLARSINEAMPAYAVNRVEDALIEKGKGTLKGCRVLVLGLSYKAGIADDRESPSHKLVAELKARGAKVTAFDPHLLKKSDVGSLSEALQNQQVIILATAHPEFSGLVEGDLNGCLIFFDGRGAFIGQKDTFTKKGVTYLGIAG